MQLCKLRFSKTFYPGSKSKDLISSESLSAMTALVGIMVVWMGPTAAGNIGKAIGGSFKEGFAGMSRSVTATLIASDINLKNLAKQGQIAQTLFGTNIRAMEEMNAALMSTGKYKGEGSPEIDIAGLFASGSWLDYIVQEHNSTQHRQLNTLNDNGTSIRLVLHGLHGKLCQPYLEKE
ncbi:hypothetical protein AJ80_00997 [Polytolypa hystricis UAMH7299]|uniref:Uncharacterized protein n=1 Tax=Polytolypa hystricis (strain UAMH7299) TaxID=1447883 RepID=A0A2B7Z381_POLH7|nr:hypothetical protein AJ80_00997 [Polytolypa hystricis UAMH7299]